MRANWRTRPRFIVYWFDDHIEIRQSGRACMGGVSDRPTISVSQEGVVGYRNPKLAEALGKTQLIEICGYGIGFGHLRGAENDGSATAIPAAGISMSDGNRM